MKKTLLYFIFCVLSANLMAQELSIVTLTGVEDSVPSHYKDTYNLMRYCLNDPFNYDPQNYFSPEATTPAPVQTQINDTTCFVALSNEDKLFEYYGEDTTTFWTDYPFANNVIFEFNIPEDEVLRYLDVWGRIFPKTAQAYDRRSTNLIVELYNEYGNSISMHSFDLSSSTASYPAFKRVDLFAIGLDPLMLKLATGIRIRHKERHIFNSDLDFLQVMEVRLLSSEMVEEISITGAQGGAPLYTGFNDKTEYIYNDNFVYNVLSPLSSTPDLTWRHEDTYTPGLDTAVYAVKAGEDSWIEVFFDLEAGQSVAFIDLWTDERSHEPSAIKEESFKNLIITLIDSVNNTSWSSSPWSGIDKYAHYGRYNFPSDIPDNLIYNATSIKVENQENSRLLVIFEARLGGVTRANTVPVADAGEEQFVTAGDTVTLDASGTVDPDTYQELEYIWIASGLSLDKTDPVRPTFIAPDVTDTTRYSIRLRVSDGIESSARVTTYVTVYPKVVNGINKQEAIQLKVYPNPSNGNVTIQLNELSNQTQLEIFNTMGQMIYHSNVDQKMLNLDRNIFSEAGMYIIRIKDNNKQTVSNLQILQ